MEAFMFPRVPSTYTNIGWFVDSLVVDGFYRVLRRPRASYMMKEMF